MTEKYTKCPLCGGELSILQGKQKVYSCGTSEDHKFYESHGPKLLLCANNTLRWSPSITVDTTNEDLMYFREYSLSEVSGAYTEIFSQETTENLLSIIQSQMLTIREVISEYNNLGDYVKALESKVEAYNAARANSDTTLFGRPVLGQTKTPAGIILKP